VVEIKILSLTTAKRQPSADGLARRLA